MPVRDCCPECRSTASIYERQRGCHGGPDPSDAKAYHCRECGATFDDPDTRELDGQPPRVEPARSLWLRGQEQESEE